MPFLQDKWEALSEKTRKILEIVIGVSFALLTGFFISRPHNENSGFFDLNILLAAAIALAGPNILETQTGNKLPVLRKYMLIALVIVIGLFALNAYFKWFAFF